MPKPLTDTQRQFISKYVTNKVGKDKARITKQYQDFDRRRGKVEAELAALPADHEALPGLRMRLAAADAKARGPDDASAPAFDAAYKDLDAVKRDARAAAKGYHKALTPAAITARLDAIENGLRPIDQVRAANVQAMADLVAEVKGTPVPSIANYDDVVAFQASLTKREARWRGEADNCRVMAEYAARTAAELGVEDLVKLARHDLAQFKAGADKKTAPAAGPLEQRLATLDANANSGGSYRSAATVTAEFAAQDAQLAEQIRTLRNVQVRENTQDTGNRFKAVQEREQAIMDRARTAYANASNKDAAVLDPGLPRAAAPNGPPEMGTFNTSDMIGHAVTWLTEDQIDDATIAKAAEMVKAKTAAFVAKEAARTPNSDKLFDLTMRSMNELRVEAGACLGLAGAPSEWPPKSRALAEAAATAIKAALLENNPNRTSDVKVQRRYEDTDYDVPDSVTQNGVTYTNPEIIGKGGAGLISRYQGPANGGVPSTMIMKSMLEGSSDGFYEPYTEQELESAVRGDMVGEMRVHRALMGGEADNPHPNVVKMKGAAVGSNGSLHMILEDAQAGDANNLSHAVSALVRNGLLPKAAQQALQQDTMLQAAHGLKALHDLGLVHNDLKAVNYLVDIDGTVKVGDFGTGETAEHGQDRTPVTPGTTDVYAAPDYGRGTRSDKTDIYALGSMLHGMDAEYGVEGKSAEANAKADAFRNQADTGHGATSLDRLRNAMMAPDPKDRPTLEGILMSSYLNDALEQHGDQAGNVPGVATAASNIETLRKAMAAYCKEVGRELSRSVKNLNKAQGELAKLAKNGTPAGSPEATDLQATIIKHQATIDTINARPEIETLLNAVRQAGALFGRAKGDEFDNKWDFAVRHMEDEQDRMMNDRTAPPLPGNLQDALQDAQLNPVPAQ